MEIIKEYFLSIKPNTKFYREVVKSTCHSLFLLTWFIDLLDHRVVPLTVPAHLLVFHKLQLIPKTSNFKRERQESL